MGSGLILLAIVAAWLAVLVPMALRNHDVNTQGTVDKFHDAMRVLSRRDSGGRPPEPPSGQPIPRPSAPVEEAVAAKPVKVSATAAARARQAERAQRPRATAAQRRRRALIGLLVLCLGTLAGAVVGPTWLLVPHLVADLLLVGFLGYLRGTAGARADREWRTAMATERPAARRVPAERPAEERPAVEQPAAPARPALRPPVHVAGIPDRMPARPTPLGAPVPVPAARAEELPAARGAQGEAWSPVPVPTPTYLSAPAAPRRAAELAQPASDAELAEAERELGIVDEGPQLDEILERRRAVNDW